MERYHSEPEDFDVDLGEEDGAASRRTVKFVGPDGEEMSDAESSICQSPSWEGYGRQKQKKKEKASKRKEEREQADRDAKVAKKRLAARLSKNPPPSSGSRPASRASQTLPANERSSSAPVLSQQAVAEGVARPGPRPLPEGHASLASSAFNMARLFNSRKSDSDKKVSGKKPMEMITYVPLSYAVMGHVALAPSASAAKRQSVDSLNSSIWTGRYEDSKAGEAPALVRELPPRDPSHPPSASRSHALLLAAKTDRSRSSSVGAKTPSRDSGRYASDLRDPGGHRVPKSASASSTSSDSAPSTPVADERGRTLPRGSYVHSVRAQSTDRAFSGFMDEQLVSMVNDVSAVKPASLLSQPLTALRAAQTNTRPSDLRQDRRPSTARHAEPVSEKKLAKSGASRVEEREGSNRNTIAGKARQADAEQKEVAARYDDGETEDEGTALKEYFGTSPQAYEPPTMDLLPPVATMTAPEEASTDKPVAKKPQKKKLSGSASSTSSHAGDVPGMMVTSVVLANDGSSTLSKPAQHVSSNGDGPPSRPSSRNIGRQEAQTTVEQVDSNSALREERSGQSSPRSPRKPTAWNSSHGAQSSPLRGEFLVPVAAARMARKTEKLDLPALAHQPLHSASARRHADAADSADSSSILSSLPPPSAPGFRSTTTFQTRQEADVSLRRASSALGLIGQDESRDASSCKAARVFGELGNPSSHQPAAATSKTNGKPLEVSSSSSSLDEMSSSASPATTPDMSRPQSRRGYSSQGASAAMGSRREVTAVSEDEDGNDGVILLQDQSSMSSRSSEADQNSRARPTSAHARMNPRARVDETWSRTALPIDMDGQHAASGADSYEDELLSKPDLLDAGNALVSREALAGGDGDGEKYGTVGNSQPASDLLERSTSPLLRRQAMSPQGSRTRRSPFERPHLPLGDSTQSGKSSSSSDAGKSMAPKLRSALVPNSSSSSSSSSANGGFDSVSGFNSSAAYLQEARRSAPNSSRNSSSSRPPHTGALARPALTNGTKPHSSPGPSAKPIGIAIPPEQQRPVAKMLVECCHCHFYHDLPSKLYEYMASHESIVEDKLLGVAGAITTAVKCPWCTHSMSTRCCAGYAAVVYLKERLH
jgi:hypothetical protein